MITAVCFLLLVGTVPLLGGRLSRLGEIRLRAWWTIILSLVIQVFLLEVFASTLDGLVAATIHLLSYALAISFVWYNRHVTGMALIVVGGLLNLAAIAANGGVMPAQRSALETAGIITDSPEFENSAIVENARLWFLGDIFAIPENIPFANVFSVGDIILVLGGGITVHTLARSRLGTMLAEFDPLKPGRIRPKSGRRAQENLPGHIELVPTFDQPFPKSATRLHNPPGVSLGAQPEPPSVPGLDEAAAAGSDD